MKCPYCAEIDNKVVDSRLSKDGRTIRRRRECIKCERRFTTYEKLEDVLPMVIKKDGRREPFSREKITEGIKKACQKRPISITKIEDFVDSLELYFQELGKKEVEGQFSLTIVPAASPQAAVDGADIVCMTSTARDR